MDRKTVPPVRTTLWLHLNFLRLWSAETISLFGTQVTLLALPTVAIVLLRANVAEVGVLNALQWIAFLIVGPLSGVMVDRLSRRTIMIVADLGRLVALGSVPLLFALGVRTLLHLYVVALIVSILTVFFDVAYQSFLPDIVEQEALVEGNAKLALGERLPASGDLHSQDLSFKWWVRLWQSRRMPFRTFSQHFSLRPYDNVLYPPFLIHGIR